MIKNDVCESPGMTLFCVALEQVPGTNCPYAPVQILTYRQASRLERISIGFSSKMSWFSKKSGLVFFFSETISGGMISAFDSWLYFLIVYDFFEAYF